MKIDWDETRSLTHNYDRIDPINRQNQGYSSKFRKSRSWSTSANFFLVDRRNVDLKHSVDAEMSLEVIGNKRFKIFGV